MMTFEELLDEHNIPTAPAYHHHNTQGWIQFDCPFCGKGAGKWHMGYNIAGKYANCWQCGGHTLYSIVRELFGLSESQTRAVLQGLDAGVAHRTPELHVRQTVRCPRTSPLCPAHARFLKHRHFDPGLLETTWEIQYLAGPGLVPARLAWRIWIPIKHHGKLVSWTTRAVGSKVRPRYRSADASDEVTPHKHLLYGSDYARHTIIICEGPLDVWRIGPGAVATFGIAYTPKQVLAMTQYARRVVCYDNEPEAQKQAAKLCDELSVFPGETYNVKLDAKDAAEATLQEISELRNFLLGAR